MALMTCPECGKEISDAAIACPNCGLPRPALERQSRERRHAEAEAHAEHREGVRNLYIAAAVFGLGAVGLLAVIILTPWSQAALAVKGEEALVALVCGGVCYGLYRMAVGKQPPSHP